MSVVAQMDRRRRLGQAVAAVICYYLTSGVIFVGVHFGVDFLALPKSGMGTPIDPTAGLLGRWDGVWYRKILVGGYFYSPSVHSSTAFFPGYPLLALCVQRATTLSPDAALALTSHTCLIAAVLLLQEYEKSRRGQVAGNDVAFSVVALCLWPMGLFLRMAYGESLFLMLVIVTLLGVSRSWPLWVVALLAGAATGTRSVGVALLLPLMWDCSRRSQSYSTFVARTALYGPLACWGLLGYMAYLYLKFGDAMVFVKTQQHWAIRPDLPWPDRLWSLVLLEPFTTVYDPSSAAFWAKHEQVANPLFSLQFWNPIYFVSCAVLVALGAWKRWLSPPEWLLAVGLLGIPYYFQGYRMMMLGFGRFTCVVFPMHLVLGRLLARFPPTVSAVVCVLMGVQLFYWSALFAAWYRVF